MSEIWREEFLHDLCPRVQPLIARLLDSHCGCAILEFFHHRPLTWLEASDIAYHLRQSLPQVIDALNLLVRARVIEFRKILDFTFYGLTRDLEIRRALEQFWVWRDYWHARLEHIRERLQLNAPNSLSAMGT
ncbi:MAG: winged helix-turn-helix transcriptional regulator [Chloroflexi bacterium]|nr:winged helix-turn-helix transcriptional regulator [Chloroflexota bacterium]